MSQGSIVVEERGRRGLVLVREAVSGVLEVMLHQATGNLVGYVTELGFVFLRTIRTHWKIFQMSI